MNADRDRAIYIGDFKASCDGGGKSWWWDKSVNAPRRLGLKTVSAF